MELPTQHQTIMPYLILEKAEAFIEFAKQLFGANIHLKKLREDEVTIMHAELSIGNSTIMLAEATDQWTTSTAGLFVYVPDTDTAYQQAMASGATSIMEPADQNYGRSCGVKDTWGNTWWITTPPE